MKKHSLAFRQVHLDFHTSEHIPEVGSHFDPEDFATTLEKAHVNSITCFARCHHGWIYYDSKKFKHLIHPNLKRPNLLKEQIEACHRHGIKVPVYITVQWDYRASMEHPEWTVLDEKGAPFDKATFKPGFYRNLCLNTEYVAFLKEQTQDVLENLGVVDGLFFDILNLKPCACRTCVKEMQALGLDATDEAVRWEFAQEVMDRFKREMTKFVQGIQPDCPIFYNAGHIGFQHRKAIDTFTHLEIESLPGGFWGYDHFPVTARYTRTFGLDFLGMTGKFHTEWGDFSSFKNLHALEYECFKSLAYNGKCSIGDQLAPNGAISHEVYDLIGKVYSQVEEKEPWCDRSVAVTEAGILNPEEMRVAGTLLTTDDLVGAVKLATEIGLQFDVVDSTCDFSKYKLLILPDSILVYDELETKLEKFVSDGGCIIASYHSGLDKELKQFQSYMGIECIGEAPYSPDFINLSGDMAKGIYETEYVMYKNAMQIEPLEGTETIATVNKPYFNRTWEHFCSHRHTPSSGVEAYPGIVRNGNVLYFSHPIFTQYQDNAPLWVKKMFENAVHTLLGSTLVAHDGPSTLEITVNQQEEHNRYVLHALHYIPIFKSNKMDIIEDIIPLHDVRVQLRLPKAIKSVTLVPEGKSLSLNKKEDGSTEFVVPTIRGHQMIELEYEL